MPAYDHALSITLKAQHANDHRFVLSPPKTCPQNVRDTRLQNTGAVPHLSPSNQLSSQGGGIGNGLRGSVNRRPEAYSQGKRASCHQVMNDEPCVSAAYIMSIRYVTWVVREMRLREAASGISNAMRHGDV